MTPAEALDAIRCLECGAVARIIETNRFRDPKFTGEDGDDKLVGCEVHVFHDKHRANRMACLFCECGADAHVDRWDSARDRARLTLRGWLLGHEEAHWAVELIESFAAKESA